MRRLQSTVFCFALILLAAPTFGQPYPFIDANRLLSARTHDEVLKILAPYVESGETADTDPLLSWLALQKTFPKSTLPPGPSTPEDRAGLSATTVADAIAQFLIQRAKDELTYDFLKRMNKTAETYPELKILLPATFEALPDALTNALQSLNYNVFISTTTTGFRSDIKALPANLEELRDPNDKVTGKGFLERKVFYRKYLASRDGLLVRAFAVISSGFVRGDTLSAIVNGIDADYAKYPPEDKKKSAALVSSVKLFGILLDSLQTTDGKWVDRDDLASVLKADVGRVYMSLVFARIRNDVVPGKDFDETFKDVENFASEAAASLSQIAKILRSTEDLKSIVADPSQSTETRLQAIAGYLEAVSGLFDGAMSCTWLSQAMQSFIAKTVSGDPAKFFSEARELLKDAQAGIHVAIFLSKSDYPSAFAASATIAKNIFDTIRTDDSLYKASEEQKKILKNVGAALALYGGFVAAVARAGNADELEAVIAQYALPATSYQERYLDGFVFKLGAYLGVDAAYDTGLSRRWPDNYGAYAPVGFGVSANLPFLWGFIDSEAIFIGVVDVGALVSYGLSDSSSTLPELTWADLLSPSINAVFGVLESPIVFGFGCRLAPWRSGTTPLQLHAFLAFDVPLLRFASSP